MRLLLADTILFLHFLIVAFNIGLVPMIWVGFIKKWKWIRNPWIRYFHLLLLSFIVLETILGWLCPLTVWEHELRRLDGADASEKAFMAELVSKLMYYDFPPWVFLLAYVLFLLLVVITFIKVPPKFR